MAIIDKIIHNCCFIDFVTQIFMLAICINLSYMSGVVNVYIYSFKKLKYYKYDRCIAVIIGTIIQLMYVYAQRVKELTVFFYILI